MYLPQDNRMERLQQIEEIFQEALPRDPAEREGARGRMFSITGSQVTGFAT